jgi:hypothetical protein
MASIPSTSTPTASRPYYRLSRNAEGIPGWPVVYFESYRSLTTKKVYCDIGEAFENELAIASDGRSKPADSAEARVDPHEEAEKHEARPDEQEIGEDCVAFVRSTTIAPTTAGGGPCPTCPKGGPPTEVLRFNGIHIERISSAGATCVVDATLRATFNPSAGGTIAGGLAAWISPEQRAQYARGETPPGEQAYRVKITYRRGAKGWRPVEFDRGKSD